MAHDVFISYASKDKQIADTICASLERANIKCWIAPRDINPGQEWPEAIVEGINSSKALVLVFSDNANNSKDVAKEIYLAISLNLELFPVKVKDSEPAGVMKYYLADIKWSDATKQPVDKTIETLIEELKIIIPEKEPDTGVSTTNDNPAAAGKSSASETGFKLSNLSKTKKKVLFFTCVTAGIIALVLPGISFYSSFFPAQSPTLNITSTAAGIDHSIILMSNGDVYTFGSNACCKLGFDDFENKLAPTILDGISDVANVSTGGNHTLLNLENGDIYSVGSNKYGQLGHGDHYNRNLPAGIDSLAGIEDISAGEFHSLFLMKNGDVYSCGAGWDGQLGCDLPDNSRYYARNTPEKIETISGAIAISAGKYHSLVLLENGDLYSFGNNRNGQLGLGDKQYRYIPEKVETLFGVKAVAAGSTHSLVLLENGYVYSFGSGNNGKLGHGDKESLLLPKRINGLTDIVAIAAGDMHSLVLTASGQVYSFGSGKFGALGHGDEKDKLVPTRIDNLDNIKAIDAGRYYSIAVDKDDTIYTFGRNESGQLGTGDIITRFTPEPIDFSPATKDNLSLQVD